MRRNLYSPQENARRVRIQQDGRFAFRNGHPKGVSPHKPGSLEDHWYEEGWLLEWQLLSELKSQGVGA